MGIRMFLWVVLIALCIEVQAQTNPVVIGNSRFTFITPGLVRLEYALDGKFLDDPTLFAYNREVGYQDVKVEKKEENHYTITTPEMRLEFTNDGFPFGQTNLRVYFKQGDKEKWWYIASEQNGNLGGAVTTLDAIGGPIDLQEGLLSRDGWYVINDTGKEVLKNGWVENRHREHVQDIYLFVYGNDYKAALKSLKAISGATPMTRKYVHGAWYCRWWNYTDDDYREIVNGYKEHDFPMDILVFDMGWHTQKQAKAGTGHAGMKGWTGYSWNRELIKDPAGLIGELKKDGIYVVLNEHPHDGLRDHDDRYPAFMRAMGEPLGKNLLFDAGSRKYMENFMKYAHEESDSMGVAFWWLDWQQDYLYPKVRGTDLSHLQWLNHIYFDYSRKNNLRGAGFSRWAGWGDHRHPIQFSGDAVANWELLKFQIELTATSGNAGCFFWAHDLGGFYGGKDPELYTRWTQFGLLNSSLRVHSVYDENLDRRPWLWGEQEEKSMRLIYHLRSELMPYIYSSVWQCHRDMLPLNRAMYIEYPEADEAYRNPQQFLFGDLILGAPITKAGTGSGKVADQKVWLPEGDVWYQWFSGQRYDGGQVVTESCDLQSFPLYVKGGYPIPMQPYTPRMATTPLNKLVVRCYPGAGEYNHSYTLYEDDGESRDYEQGGYALTKLASSRKAGKCTLTVSPVVGTYKGQPQKRAYRFELAGLLQPVTVKVNGKKVKAVKDEAVKGYVVEVKPYQIHKEIVIEY